MKTRPYTETRIEKYEKRELWSMIYLFLHFKMLTVMRYGDLHFTLANI